MIRGIPYNPKARHTRAWGSHLRFPLVALYASIARASVRARMPYRDAAFETISALTRYDHHLQPTADLMLRGAYYGYYKDADVTHTSGRIGDGVGLLLADRLGFPLFAHFEDIGRVTRAPSSRRPDYVVFNSRVDEAQLLECKGSCFKGRSELLQPKGEVNDGLNNQVRPWLGLSLVLPALSGTLVVDAGFVAGTHVNALGSSVSVKEARLTASVPLPPTAYGAAVHPAVRHYVRWLRQMHVATVCDALLGLTEARERLRDQLLSFAQVRYGNDAYVYPYYRRPRRFDSRFAWMASDLELVPVDPTRPSRYPMIVDGERSTLTFAIERRRLEALLKIARARDERPVTVEDSGLLGVVNERQRDAENERGVYLFRDGALVFEGLERGSAVEFEDVVEL